MVHLTYIPPAELTEEDLYWLDNFVQKWSYDGSTVEDYLARIAEDRLAAFRLSGEAEGLMGFETASGPQGRELWMEFISGKNVLEKAGEIMEEAFALGRKIGAKTFFVSAARDAIVDVAEKKTGLKKVATILMKDLSDEWEEGTEDSQRAVGSAEAVS